MNAQPATTRPSPAPVAITTGTAGPLIKMNSVGKVFHTDEIETHALTSVHLDVQKGEFVSISGPSGSGKSTLLAILGLLDVPSSGEYRIAGEDTRMLTTPQRAALRNRTIGFIFQAFN